MAKRQYTRRSFLELCLAATAGGAVLAACTPKVAPTQPTTEAGTVPEQQAAQPVKDRAAIRVASWEIADRTFMKDAAIEFGEQHDDVQVEVEVWIYNEAMTKALTGLATGTLADVFYAHVRWARYLAFKGVVLALDEYIKTADPAQGFVDDFYPAALDAPSFEGGLYGLPIEMNAGGAAIVFYNKQLLADKGIPEPTDDWTVTDFSEIAAKIQDRPNKIFGTTYTPNNLHYWSADARTFGSDALSPDGKQCLFATDPKSVEAARWIWALRNEYDAGALRAEMEGLTFQAGRVGLERGAVQAISSILGGVGDRFEVGIVICPHGPEGNRGYFTGVSSMLVGSGTKYAQEAFDCAAYIASKEWSERAFVEQGQPPARKSVWAKSDQLGVHPVWKRVADWMLAEKTPGNFPMPYNLRFQELNDKYVNTHQALWYGEVPFEEGIQRIQTELDSVVTLPRE